MTSFAQTWSAVGGGVQVRAPLRELVLEVSRPLEELCAGVGASKRTIERLFLRETGATVGRWRQQVRLMEALRLLADGMSVTQVAYLVGY